jgi:hypothetical protein
LSRASIRTALRKSKTSVDITSTSEPRAAPSSDSLLKLTSESVAKQVNYHWKTLKTPSLQTFSSPHEKILSKLPFLRLSESDSNIGKYRTRHLHESSTSESSQKVSKSATTSDFKRHSGNSGVDNNLTFLNKLKHIPNPRMELKKWF